MECKTCEFWRTESGTDLGDCSNAYAAIGMSHDLRRTLKTKEYFGCNHHYPRPATTQRMEKPMTNKNEPSAEAMEIVGGYLILEDEGFDADDIALAHAIDAHWAKLSAGLKARVEKLEGLLEDALRIVEEYQGPGMYCDSREMQGGDACVVIENLTIQMKALLATRAGTPVLWLIKYKDKFVKGVDQHNNIYVEFTEVVSEAKVFHCFRDADHFLANDMAAALSFDCQIIQVGAAEGVD